VSSIARFLSHRTGTFSKVHDKIVLYGQKHEERIQKEGATQAFEDYDAGYAIICMRGWARGLTKPQKDKITEQESYIDSMLFNWGKILTHKEKPNPPFRKPSPEEKIALSKKPDDVHLERFLKQENDDVGATFQCGKNLLLEKKEQLFVFSKPPP